MLPKLSEQGVSMTDLKAAVFTVLEGWALPLDARKILETAYYAQPEQEPVNIHCPSCLHSFSIVPVAKREWVGLTDEEIKGILDCGRGGLVDIKKAEQILKEKNT